MEERASWLPPPQSQGAPTKVLKEQGHGPIWSLVDLALGPLLTSGSRAQQGQPHLWWTCCESSCVSMWLCGGAQAFLEACIFSLGLESWAHTRVSEPIPGLGSVFEVGPAGFSFLLGFCSYISGPSGTPGLSVLQEASLAQPSSGCEDAVYTPCYTS